MTATRFSTRLVRWQKAQGRHDLPWQATREPYSVWLSEIMLQQTQVVTVKDYFQRFMQRFPTVGDLAQASEDEVLALWSGLGYYSRARNLHRAAQQVMREHGGRFPTTASALETLPGIGPSTAAAVASICFGERVAILDGNVKRVLTRFLGDDGDLALQRNAKALWQRAQALLPTREADMPTYTQAVMDLGAMVCTPKQPRCAQCPVQDDCVAHAQGQPEAYPVKTRKLKRRAQSWWLLFARTPEGDILLEQRAERGVWAKLYAVPMFDSFEALAQAVPASLRQQLVAADAFKHVLTHLDLHLHPVRLTASRRLTWPSGEWLPQQEALTRGLPAPIRKWLASD